MSELLEAALDYVGRGWPVLPCVPGNKMPLGNLVVHGSKEASTDPEQIRAWWSVEPTANVGLVTGVYFDVLDIDGEAGWSTLAHSVSTCGTLPSSPVSITGGSGGHDLFLPTGCKNRVGFLPHLDWRGVGGYIVAPPSIHPNGTRYEWALSPDEVPIGAAPPWLVDLVNGRPVGPGHAMMARGGRTVGPSIATAYGSRVLEAQCGRLSLAQEGTRNDQLNQSAYVLGLIAADGHLDIGVVIQALLYVARQTGLGDLEAERTIESGLAAGLRSRGGLAC
jgi:hypothetical protein